MSTDMSVSIVGKPHPNSFYGDDFKIEDFTNEGNQTTAQEHSQQQQREKAIADAKNEFYAMAMQLKSQNDVEALYRKALQPIIDYQSTNYLLCVREGKLEYRCAKFMYGTYTDGVEVLNFITKELNSLEETYRKLDDKHKWLGIRFSEPIIEGLNKISRDYTGSSYQNFCDNLQQIIENFANFVDTEKTKLNKKALELLKADSKCTLFELYDTPAESYPSEPIYTLIKSIYGERFYRIVITRYASSRNEGTIKYGELQKEDLRDILICIATNVNPLDMMRIYHSVLKTDKNFVDLSEKELDQLLGFFRKAPNGQSLIDYFEIPISSKDFTLTQKYISEHPKKTLNDLNQLNETAVLTDIESVKYWLDDGKITIPLDEMYDHLNIFFSHPFKGQLFHTDRYLSFLKVAATSIAYVDYCKNEEKDLSTQISPLIYLMEDVVAHSGHMYPSKFVTKYQEQWNGLITQLKAIVDNPQHNLQEYTLSLYTHPLQEDNQKKKAIEVHQNLKASEFLARKVAYWNRYYLSHKDRYVEEGSHSQKNDFLNLRNGTLFYVPEGGKLVLYQINYVIMEEGFVCQIASPLSSRMYRLKNTPIPIKVMFQGTIGEESSISRDKNPIGPGYGLWKDKGIELIEANLNYCMRNFRKSYSEARFDIEFVGHSLGGADAQNAASHFVEGLDIKSVLKSCDFNTICIHTFNTAGIPNESNAQFNTSVVERHPQNVYIRHSLVKDDVVECSGQVKLGYAYPYEDRCDLLEVSNLGVYHVSSNHCCYVHASSKTLLPHKILDKLEDHTAIRQYFQGATHSWKDFTGHAHQMYKEMPGAQIVYNSFYLASYLLGSYATASQSSGGSAVSSYSVVPYHVGREAKAIEGIWEGIAAKWHGKQILEGTA